MKVPRSIRKLLVGFVVVLVVCFAAYLRFHHSKPPLEVAYVGNRQIIVWNTSAEVREQSGTLNYGDRVEVLDRFRDQVEIRVKGGVMGWVRKTADLIPCGVLEISQDLEAKN